MNGLSEFAVSFCTVCVVMGILYMLCPKSATERAVKYVFSLVMLICIISALPGLRNAFSGIDIQGNIGAETEALSESVLRLTFETALKNSDIEFSKITVCTDKSETGSIKITKVVVISSSPADEIHKVLGDGNGAYTIEVHP